MKKSLLIMVLAGILAGCAQFPSGGPGSSTLLHPSAEERIQTITPAMATAEARRLRKWQAVAVTNAVTILRDYAEKNPYSDVLRPGDILRVQLWSYSGLNVNVANGSGLAQTNLSPVTVDARGRIFLPYLHPQPVAGKSPGAAAESLATAYAQAQILEDPQVQVQVVRNTDGVWVYGAGSHHFLPWAPNGWTLAQALSQVSGGNISGSGKETGGTMPYGTHVHIFADGRLLTSLPIADALHHHIPLVPGERLVESFSAPVQVSVLGSGMAKPGVYSFDGNVPVSQVLAEAGGLNGATANYRYVLLYQPEADVRNRLAVFHWSRSEGFLAAQRYLVENDSVLYVSSQPIVKLSRALGMLLAAALPVQAFK